MLCHYSGCSTISKIRRQDLHSPSSMPAATIPSKTPIIAQSAGAGQEALDSLGAGDRNPNGVFTRVLVKEIKNPGIPAEQILRRVRDQVVSLARSVKHEQVPALYDQYLGEFYFAEGTAAGGTRPAGSIQVDSTGELEQAYWNRIKNSTDHRDFDDYSRAFPTGLHAAEAALLARKLSASGATGRSTSEHTASTTTPSVSGRNVSLLVSPVAFNKRPVAQAPTVMFEQVRSIPGLIPTLSQPGPACNAIRVSQRITSSPNQVAWRQALLPRPISRACPSRSTFVS